MAAHLSQEQRVRRTILEELPEVIRTSPAKPYVSYIYIPVLRTYSKEFAFVMLDILECERRIGLMRLDDDDRAVTMTPLGARSLEHTEEDWQALSSQQIVNHSLVHNIFYGSVGNVAQNSTHFNQTASIGIRLQDLTNLVTEITLHLEELNLDIRQKQRAEAQITTLKAELAGEPDSEIVKQAVRTLRNITEGAIGSLLATAAQPTVWHWVQQMLSGFV